MPKPRSVDQLSSEARNLLYACFAEGLTAAETTARLKDTLDVELAERTVGRRKAEWTEAQARRQRGREQLEDLVSASRKGNATASEMLTALAMQQLMNDPDGVMELDPIALQQTSIKAEQVKLQAQSLALKEREIALSESKFALLKAERERALAATSELEKKAQSGQQLTADDIRRIREVYGLA